MEIVRRRNNWSQSLIIALFAICLMMVVAPKVSHAESGTTRSHGLSAFGDLAYPPDFEHFSYVIPVAPKGGTLSTTGIFAQNSFDNLNPFILKGDAAEGLTLLQSDGFSLVFESLMVKAGDEADAVYGLVASEAELPADRSWVTFYLRPEARFQDGTGITADDIVFSFNILKEKGDPIFRQNLRDVASATALGPHSVKYTFAEGVNTRDLPLIVAQLPILSKTYYSEHEFDETTLEPPLASGPYKVGRFEQGRYIEYERVKDYWAKDLPVNVGRWNFDNIRYSYYRDRQIKFQAFTAGEYDLREEFTSRTWATQYNFDAVKEGRVIKRSIDDETPSGVQGYFLNTRRPQFSDVRVRKALDLLHDFEWTNHNLFFGLYDRTTSFFQGADDLFAWGAPQKRELELLEKHRSQLPPQIFSRAYMPPKNNGSGNIRDNMAMAQQLFVEAGWNLDKGKLINANRTQLSIEFLTYEPSFGRVIAPYVENMKRLGIDARIRQVDTAQFQRRLEEFEFDIIVSRYSQRLTPGVELRNFFGSASADIVGSRNLAGIKDPVVDALIDEIISAENRKDLEAACRALDRVLREGHYWVPHWSKGAHHLAHWDKFGWPAVKPRYQRGILDTWWSLKAAKKNPPPKPKLEPDSE